MFITNQQIPTTSLIIDLGEEQSCNFWTAAFGVSIEELKSAVRATRSVDYSAIRSYFNRTKNENNLKDELYAKN